MESEGLKRGLIDPTEWLQNFRLVRLVAVISTCPNKASKYWQCGLRQLRLHQWCYIDRGIWTAKGSNESLGPKHWEPFLIDSQYWNRKNSLFLSLSELKKLTSCKDFTKRQIVSHLKPQETTSLDLAGNQDVGDWHVGDSGHGFALHSRQRWWHHYDHL